MGRGSGLINSWSGWLITLSIAVGLWLSVSTTVQARANTTAVMATNCPSGTVIYVNQQAVGINTGDSWTDAFIQLQDALALAGNCPAVQEIWVAKGIYYPDEGSGQTNNNRSATFQLRNNLAIYGGFAGHETLLNERNWPTNITVLSGDLDQNDTGKDANGVIPAPNQITGANAYRVVMGNALTTTAVLDGFTITGGKADGASASPCSMGCGGGVNNYQSSPTLRNLAIIGNYAANQGGGIYNLNSHPILQNLTIKANQAAIFGGGLYNSNSNPTLTNGLLSGNLANSRGGAIYNTNSNPTIINATLSGNRAGTKAGGLYNNSSSPDFINVIIWGNEAVASPELENSSTSRPKFRHSIVNGSGGSPAWNIAIGDDYGNNVDSDPRFVTMLTTGTAPSAAGDLHLRAASFAIDAGFSSANTTTTDAEGAVRYQSSAIDIGAYESTYTAQLTVSAQQTPAVIEFHEPITYTFVVSNSGDAYAYHTLLTNTFPSNLAFAHWQTQPLSATYDSGTNTVAWNGTVAASTAITFTFVATHTGQPNEVVTNTVTISHPTGGASAASAFTVLPLPTMTIADTVEPEARGQATFTVTLSALTRKTVSVTYTTENGSALAPGDFTATTGVLIIPAGVQTATFTIPVINDDIDENNEGFEVLLSSPVNATLDNSDAAAAIIDDDTAGNQVAPTNLTVSEPSESKAFTISLTTQPEAAVNVALTSSDATECSVPASITITAQNWRTGVAVPVTAVNDDVVDGNQPCAIQTVVSSADPHYNGMAMADINVTVQSEDVAGVTITPSTPVVSEPNVSTVISIALTSQPIAPVQIALTSTVPTECSVPAAITLTAANWRTGVAVTVGAFDDEYDDGSQTCTIQTVATSSDANYQHIAVADPPVTVLDDDVASVTVAPQQLTISEPNTASSFSLRLTSKPYQPVTIKLSSSDTGECEVGLSSVTFDATNWNVNLVVPVTAVDDEIDDGDQPCTAKTLVTSTDPSYSKVGATDVLVTVQNDSDAAGMVVSTTALTVSEPSSATSYLLTLTSQPVASVVVNLSTTDPGECSVPASVTLTSSDWRTGKSITVTAVDDPIIDGPQSCVIQATAASTDAKYAGMKANNVTVNVQDNDLAGVRYTLGKTTLQEANDNTLLVAKLTSQPFADVTIALVNSDPSECKLPSTITLNSTNWQTGVGVMVQSVDDDLDDETQHCTLQSTVSSGDTYYHALAVTPIQLSVDDDETAGFVVSPTTLTVNEPNSTANFGVALTSQPTATVTITLTSSDTTECSVPATLTLTPLNWQTGVTTTVQAVDDHIADDNRPCLVSMAATSPDGDYHQLTPAAVNTTVKDDDKAGVVVAPTELRVQEPAGTAFFTITLTSEPTATVTVALTPDDASECSLPFQVALDKNNWAAGVKVLVSALDDKIDDGAQLCTVQTTISSADAHYAGLAAADVATTVEDDSDTASVIVGSTVLTVTEPASTQNFTVVLTSEPTAPVTITVTPANSQCTATKTLVFTPADWQADHLVTVQALDDWIVDGVRPCTLHAAAASADGNYHDIDVTAVAVAVQDDNDTAGIVMTSTTQLLQEANGQATVRLALTSEPTATVTLAFSSSDPTECKAPTTVTLNELNWRTGLTMTVTAVDDQLDDGDQPCTITLAATSSDPSYQGRAVAPLPFSVANSDLVALKVAAWTDVSTAQLGQPITYTYRVTNTGDVTLTIQAVATHVGALAITPQAIAPHSVAQGVAYYTIKESDAPGPFQSTVVVTGTAVMGTIVTDQVEATVGITIMPTIAAQVERLSPPQISDGAVVTYQVSITNTGFVAALVEQIEGVPHHVAQAAAVEGTTCTAPLTLSPQTTYRCLLLWKAVKNEGDVVEFAVTVRIAGPLQSSAVLKDSAIVIVSGPNDTLRYLYLPLVKR